MYKIIRIGGKNAVGPIVPKADMWHMKFEFDAVTRSAIHLILVKCNNFSEY